MRILTALELSDYLRYSILPTGYTKDQIEQLIKVRSEINYNKEKIAKEKGISAETLANWIYYGTLLYP